MALTLAPGLVSGLLTGVLLALVQGATELLPVSSSGHLVLLGVLPGWDGEPFFVISLLHLATGLAVVIYWRRLYWELLRGIWRPGPRRRFLARYMAAQVATGAVGLPLLPVLSRAPASEWGASWDASLWLVGAGMLVNAGVLLLAPRRGHQGGDDGDEDDERLPDLDWRGAVLVGLAQGLAALPGLSRSGLTMAAGLGAGLSPGEAARLSYLLAGPVMVGAALFAAGASSGGGLSVDGVSAAVAVGMAAVAFGVALGAVRWAVSWVSAGRMWWFAPWSGGLGIVALALAWAGAVTAGR